MVRNDLRDLVKPEMGELREHFTFARNAVGHHAIERGDTIARDKKEGVAQVKNFADLAAFELLDARQFESQDSVVGNLVRHRPRSMGRARKFASASARSNFTRARNNRTREVNATGSTFELLLPGLRARCSRTSRTNPRHSSPAPA